MAKTSFWKGRKPLLIFGIVVLVLTVVGAAMLSGNKPQATVANCKYLLSYDRDGAVSPTYFANNAIRVENATTNFPYNGVVILESYASGKVFTTTPVSVENFHESASLQALRNMTTKPTKLRHNMVRVLLHYPGDFFNDAAWTTVASNFGNLAQALKEVKDSGFPIDGIFFDNEGPYDQTSVMWDFPRDWAGSCPVGARDCDLALIKYPEKGLTAYQDKVRARGKQIMDAMTAKWADIKIMPLLDSDFSCTDADLWWKDELIGSFTAGLMEGTINKTAKVTDGGEYSYYFGGDEARFITEYNLRKTGMPAKQPQCAFMTHPSPDLRTYWSQYLNIGFGLYNGSQTTSNIRSAVRAGLLHADDYVWFYTENKNSIDPTASNYIGSTWMTQIVAGRLDAPNDSTCGTTPTSTPTTTVTATPTSTSTGTPTPTPTPTVTSTPVAQGLSVRHWPKSIRSTTDVTITASTTGGPAGTINIYVDGNLAQTCSNAISCAYTTRYISGTHSYYASSLNPTMRVPSTGTNQFRVK